MRAGAERGWWEAALRGCRSWRVGGNASASGAPTPGGLGAGTRVKSSQNKRAKAARGHQTSQDPYKQGGGRHEEMALTVRQGKLIHA